MKLRLILAAIGFAIVVSACAPAPEVRNDRYLQDNSFITGDPCEAPCWRGITPGETSWNDAVILVQDDPTLNDFEERADDESDSIGAIWGQADGDRCCQMFTEDGENVEFIILQTAPNEDLETVLEVHGDPEYVIGETFSGDQGIMTLFYTETPMIIYAFVEGEAGELTAQSEIVGFAYMTPENMDVLLESGELQAWEGYQTYQYYAESEPEITPVPTTEGEDGEADAGDSSEDAADVEGENASEDENSE